MQPYRPGVAILLPTLLLSVTAIHQGQPLRLRNRLQHPLPHTGCSWTSIA